MPDAAQSVLDRLKNKARASGRSVQLVLQLFCQEEFLRRLQLSQYGDKLILKGGLLLYSLSKFPGRPTMDVDSLAKSIRSELSTLEKVVREIAETNTGNDYIQVVAEKLDAIVSRMELASRMKDSYDLYYLAQTVRFDARTLQEAIYQTLQRRGTRIERSTLAEIRRLADSPSFRSRWERFTRDRLTNQLGLGEALSSICALIGPLLEAIVDENEAFGVWDPLLSGTRVPNPLDEDWPILSPRPQAGRLSLSVESWQGLAL